MLRAYFTNKWVLGGFCFLIVFGIACYFWYQHELAPYKQTSETLRQSERVKKAETVREAEQAVFDTPMESETPTEEKPITETTAEAVKTDTPSGESEIHPNLMEPRQEMEKTEVRVSPYGFGPYPEVPEDYFIPPAKFKWDFWGETLEGELMSRVRIKLWKQGIRSEGASFSNGKVYPTIAGTVYVERDGDTIRGITGHPDDDFDAIRAALEAGHPPPEGITVLNRNEAGIDPYTFLELNRKE